MNIFEMKKVACLILIVSLFPFYAPAQADIAANQSIKAKISREAVVEFDNSLKLEAIQKKLELEQEYYIDFDSIIPQSADFVTIKDVQIVASAIKLAKQQQQKQESQEVQQSTYNINMSTGEKIVSVSPVVNTEPVQQQYNSSPVMTVKQSVDKAKKYIAQQNYDEAMQVLDNAPIENERDEWQIAEVASLYEQMRDYNRAIEIYKLALNANPGRMEILYSYALCLFKKNDLANAQRYFERVITVKPEFMLAYYNLGNIYFKRGDYYKALDYFNKAIKLNPLSSDACFNIALTLETLNYKNMALKYYNKTLELNPNDSQSLKAVRRLRFT